MWRASKFWQQKLGSAKTPDKDKNKSLARKAVSVILISLTGGVALSAVDDLAIYRGCSSKAMEKASKSQAVIDAIGEPISKGPWYNATLAVAHQRQSVSCTFPVSGPQGTGNIRLKAVRNGDNSWLSFFWPRDFEILIVDALLHVPGNDEKHQTLRVNLSESFPSSACTACTDCKPQEKPSVEKK
ncbi:Cytochrome c oxidase assembly factor 1 [Dillenia turbinata]|uniref:Cytochrome c oxidase assembly factor 1 n=1 Tax=Dillenia turbinata TaxID=194707 RepID=A0AAN8ZK62_9MAGN